MKTVYFDTWTESERGWGTRPDGCSIHLSDADYRQYVEEYWARQPKEVPDEYSRPDGRLCAADVDDKLYLILTGQECGLRIWESDLNIHIRDNKIRLK